jgi:hypothetical protein
MLRTPSWASVPECHLKLDRKGPRCDRREPDVGRLRFRAEVSPRSGQQADHVGRGHRRLGQRPHDQAGPYGLADTETVRWSPSRRNSTLAPLRRAPRGQVNAPAAITSLSAFALVTGPNSQPDWRNSFV